MTSGSAANQRGFREYQIMDFYVRTIKNAGGIPLLAFFEEESLLELADGLFLTGGGDVDPVFFGEALLNENPGINRERDRTELCLAKWFIQKSKPVFGICRGMQVINVALGGTLWQDLPEQRNTCHTDTEHEVSVVINTKLHRLLGEKFVVNSFHHQAVKAPAKGLIVAAKSSADGIVEALEHERLPVWGVQWHPERKAEKMPDMLPIFRQFVSEAAGK